MRNGYDLLQEIIFLAGSADVASASIYFFSARPAPPFSLTLFHSPCVAVNIKLLTRSAH